MAEPMSDVAPVTRNLGRGLLGALLTASLMPLNSTMVAVAVPSIARTVGHGPAAVTQALVATYLIAAIALQSPGGKLGDRLGHWRVLMFGQAAVGAGAVLGFFATNLATPAGARILMATGGALAVPATLALLRVSLPAERRGRAFGTFGAVMATAAALGPIVGGLLVQHINWEACFYINIPVGIIALVFGLLVLRETPPSPAARSFDIPGILLLTAFLFLLVWGLIKAPDYGWTSTTTIAYFAGAVVALAGFIVREAKAKEPLLPLKLFRSVPLAAGTVLVLTLMFSLFGAMFFMTFFMENVHGTDAIGAGVHMLPLTGMMMLGAPLAGVVITKIGPRLPMFAGMLLAAVALFGLSRISMASSMNDTIIWFALLGLGLAPVMVGGTEVIVGNAAVELAGVAAGLQSTAMQVGGTIGTAVLGAVMSAKVDSLLPVNWAAAHLPVLNPAQLAGVKELTAVGVAPTQKGVPPQLAATMADVTHATFISGMTASFLVACVVAVGGALIALLTKKGHAVSQLSPGGRPPVPPDADRRRA